MKIMDFIECLERANKLVDIVYTFETVHSFSSISFVVSFQIGVGNFKLYWTRTYLMV